MAPNGWFNRSPTLLLAHSLSGQLLQGNFNGRHSGPKASVDFHIAEQGDIILCHNPHGAYGYWTHAVLYVGNEQVIDATDFSRGTKLQSVNNYRDYDEVMILRPKVPVKLRREAAQVARKEVGIPYDPLGFLGDIHSVYCSKLVWQVYSKVGVQLCAVHGWVLPDHIANSPQVACITHWSVFGRLGNYVGRKQSVP
ncbi:YiiX/YebB-like N1pC/P60 family cysteine hydrolase [Alicyclobacillus dauci]|uniref:YiiX/YebB-like N1pC/P60 family cysteine hydrolase n=1 Tax=Alicyclobacillus dauci TaxID=1475485 RepID=A0ABY6Z917_9BACL|nr:YiiX/YebB-like N1pC/P60 family cysteine hydrolase [Alicyclobacillus dauci]WAH38751.1 YiiX/YebB-like N1pC/P60 family cysteine hydrolase [Alicyclobacillus dauci]